MIDKKHSFIGVKARDIPKIIKFKATTSLRISCLFCIFKHSRATRSRISNCLALRLNLLFRQ